MAASLLVLLDHWLPQQRWYPRKGESGLGASLRIERQFMLPSSSAGLELVVLLLRVEFTQLRTGSTEPDTENSLRLQVPLAIYQYSTFVPQKLAAGTAAHLGELGPEGPWPGGVVVDGAACPEFMQAWLKILSGGEEVAGLQVWRDGSGTAGCQGGATGIKVVASEQSNTSVMFSAGGNALIAKFFRVLHAGAHPEVEIGKALAASGGHGPRPHVPALRAMAECGDDATTLVVLHDFVAGARDGWEVALAAASAGRDFANHAHAIGAELARLHAELGRGVAAAEADGAGAAALIDAIASRLEWAWPLARAEVGPWDEQFQKILAQLRQIKVLPPLQRIHGDLHLGQLLFREDEPGRGWYVLDFEGEPLRPLSDRGAPDIAMRDIAGMLRSFDYAAAQATAAGGSSQEHGAEWARNSAAHFMKGYESVMHGGISRTDPLFVALWLDKALYEVVYELQNRPAWVWVPVKAVQGLFHSRESGVTWD